MVLEIIKLEIHRTILTPVMLVLGLDLRYQGLGLGLEG